MMDDHKLARLRNHPKETRCSQADLRRVLLYLPWHLHTVVRKAELKLIAFMHRAASSWFALSISFSRAPETTIQNLIAAAKAEDLPTYRLILQWIQRSYFHPLNADFHEIEGMLPANTALQRMVECVLYDHVRPLERDLREFFRDDPRRLVTIILDGYRSQCLSLNELLSVAIDLCGIENVNYASAAIGALLEIRRRRRLPPSIEEKELAMLPEVWRRAVLFSAVRRLAFLSREYRLSLESNPLRSQDMPQTIRFHQSCEKALEAISHGYFGNRTIKVLLENRDEFLKISPRVAEALSKAQGMLKSCPPGNRFSGPEPFLYDEVAMALLLRCTGGEVLRSPEVRKRRPLIPRALKILPNEGIDILLLRSDTSVQATIREVLGETLLQGMRKSCGKQERKKPGHRYCR